MKLLDLDARFIRRIPDEGMQMVDALAEADGVMFQCPKCAEGCEKGEEDGRRFVRGAHYVICWFRGRVSDNVSPRGRWTPAGSGLGDLTFVSGNPAQAYSVLITGGCNWHGYVKDGDAA